MITLRIILNSLNRWIFTLSFWYDLSAISLWHPLANTKSKLFFWIQGNTVESLVMLPIAGLSGWNFTQSPTTEVGRGNCPLCPTPPYDFRLTATMIHENFGYIRSYGVDTFMEQTNIWTFFFIYMHRVFWWWKWFFYC